MRKHGGIAGIVFQPLIILVFGFLIALLVPPFQSPDEYNHFFRAYQVSEGQFFCEKRDARLGGKLPASLSALRDSFLYLKNNYDARLSLQGLKNGLSISLDPDNRKFTDFANTAIYAPTGYLPQALAIAILRLFNAGPLYMLYAARLANLLLWFFVIRATLRIWPYNRIAVTAIAMLPATLCIAASTNAEVTTGCLLWWLIAGFMGNLTRELYWKKVLGVIAVTLNKLITWPIILLAGFSRLNKRQLIGLFVAGTISAILWAKLAQNWFIPYDEYHASFRDSQTLNAGVDPGRQMDYVLGHPLQFMITVTKSLFRALPSLGAHFVGKFGWEKNYLPGWCVLLLWLALFGLVLSEKNPFGQKPRMSMATVLLLYVLAFAYTIYLLWIPVGADQLDNWQGRYFIPVAPLAVMAFGNGLLDKWRQEIVRFSAYILLLGNMLMLVWIWMRYWHV
ncbi:MAG: DUF2142 domain-containing protein [Lewinellaceae bacterium]|nr:DUF2142 domain-containing protein [Saprospiraceae bacterium]MCB9344684.1 DUF2142 domain-containing protein [Lewinellaceae bacterium]